MKRKVITFSGGSNIPNASAFFFSEPNQRKSYTVSDSFVCASFFLSRFIR